MLHVIFLDGYFVVNKANTQQVWCSQPYNGLDWGDITATTSSTTSLDVAVGQKTLTVDKGLDLTLSTDVTLINTYATMKGGLFSYDPLTGTMVVNVTEIKGSGNYNAWVVAVYTGSTSYASAEGSPDNIVSLATITTSCSL